MDTKDREIVTVRVINAPRELVFKAWSHPRHLEKWWGPLGFTTTTEAFEFKPGGVWKLIMHGPDGRDYDNKITYKEIRKPEFISYVHGGDGGAVEFQSTVTFKDMGNKTEVTMRGIFATAADRNRVAKEYDAVEGAKQTISRMDEYVTKSLEGQADIEPMVVSRAFKAPINLMFELWTDPKHMKNWFGPKGTSGKVAKNDFRVGGMYHYCIVMPDGKEIWGRWVYREIEKPKRIVFVSSFSDSSGGITIHPLNPNWPKELLSTITLAEKNGMTAVTVEWIPLNATEEEIKAFDSGRASMNQGWGGTFEQLEKYLAEIQ